MIGAFFKTALLFGTGGAMVAHQLRMFEEFTADESHFKERWFLYKDYQGTIWSMKKEIDEAIKLEEEVDAI